MGCSGVGEGIGGEGRTVRYSLPGDEPMVVALLAKANGGGDKNGAPDLEGFPALLGTVWGPCPTVPPINIHEISLIMVISLTKKNKVILLIILAQ